MDAAIVVLAAILVLVAIANRIGIAYPIVLVVGGMGLGFIPGVPDIAMPPDLGLVSFLPPLLYWEAVTAPDVRWDSNAYWIFRLAFGLVVVTIVVVAAVMHVIAANLGWSAAFVLGAIVSSTDEVAFSPIAERLRLPRYLVTTIEGESLVNDASSLVLSSFALGIAAGAAFSLRAALGELAVALVGAIAIGLLIGALTVSVWRAANDQFVQMVASLLAPYLAYLPAHALGLSAVLAVVTTGLVVNRFSTVVLRPAARVRARSFWSVLVFMLNAAIFTLVGLQFHTIVSHLRLYPVLTLMWYGIAISLTVIGVRLAWVFGIALLPMSRTPEDPPGTHWPHAALIAWAGMRGGVALAAALAIPVETATGFFPQRDLIIFLTFCVLLATLVGQGGTLPLVIRRLRIVDDGLAAREEQIALVRTAETALSRLDALARDAAVPPKIVQLLRQRYTLRLEEFADGAEPAGRSAFASRFRKTEEQLLEAERRELSELRRLGRTDNTVLRRVLRILDLQSSELQMLDTTGHTELDEGE